ncbi:hypothetical protein [Thiothrix sp.]|jgi:hypothetical protein|uniref:hypothetical protein n=1 Tax=Thiothrix sp. TaxID=1032 RepID=UPI00257C08B5|nr:hypothetical protein [Thiothrix sp.]
MASAIKRQRQRRGTNAKRLLEILRDGELFYVKDWQTATESPLWIGDGTTLGGNDHLSGYYAKVGDVATTATANKIVRRDANGKIAGDILGNAATATSATSATSATAAGKLSAARTITLTGAVTGTVSTDLSGNVSITTGLSSTLSGGVIYQSEYNAETNTPAIPAASAANKGHAYRVNVARTTATAVANVPTTDLKVGDFLVSTGAGWDKWDNTDPSAAEIFAQIDDIDGGEV